MRLRGSLRGLASAATLAAALALTFSACSSGSSQGHHLYGHSSAHGHATRSSLANVPSAHPHHAPHSPGGRTPSQPAPPQPPGCPTGHVLAGVYHPYRLRVIDPCRKVSGVVAGTTAEEDGDVHLDVRLDSRYRGMLRRANRTEQGGDLVVELMPRDRGHITPPAVGDRVTVVGAYVDDTDHGWAEIHPVWALSRDGGAFQRSGPQYGGDPASADSTDALAVCRTAAGTRCPGYGGAPATSSSASSSPPTSSIPRTTSSGNCNPNYSGCVPPYPPDVDCSQINGPVRVLGVDQDHLDADGDGIGCE